MPITSQDVPQADNLDTLRSVVEEIATGGAANLAEETGLPPRQLAYYLSAARAMGLLKQVDGEWEVTTAADDLMASDSGTPAESAAWRQLIEAMPLVRQHLGSLFDPAPTRASIAGTIATASSLSAATARRRAGTLARWRARLLAAQQQTLFDQPAPSSAGGAADVPEPEAPGRDSNDVRAHPSDVEPSGAPSTQTAGETEGAGDSHSAARGGSAAGQPTPIGSKPVSEGPEPSPAPASEAASKRGKTTVVTADAAVVAPAPPLLLDSADLAYLGGQVARGTVVLFTGAGFSVDAKDLDGRNLPIGDGLARDVWALLFSDEEYDGSPLTDLFGTAKIRKARLLRDLVSRRLTVDPTSVPEYMQVWFEVPWLRVYTLNIDDLEEAVADSFQLPRTPVPISAVGQGAELVSTSSGELPVAHLNGSVSDELEDLTFSAQDYAQRQAAQEPWYAQLSADLLAYPFVFVGSPLEEPLFWQHLAMRSLKSRETREHRPRSFLVTPTLPRAKQALLAEHHIHWVKATAGEFAAVLGSMRPQMDAGHGRLRASAQANADDVGNIERVPDLLAGARDSASLYLRGAEPVWGDIRFGRCAGRVADAELLERSQALLRGAEDSGTRLLLVSGTAGTGKSTGLMRLAAKLSGNGEDVAWIGPDAEVSARTLGRFFHRPDAPSVACIDEAGRYGTALLRVLRDAVGSELKLVVFAMREGQRRLLDSAALDDVELEDFTMPPLQDSDIGALLDVLTAEHRLGKLLGLPREEQEAAFREQAGRQLLVAMIQATSDDPFEEKVHGEWRQLSDSQRYFYALVALASIFRFPVDRELLLVARGTKSADDLADISFLHERHIVVAEGGVSNIRTRHTLIAEKLIERLQLDRDYMASVWADLTFATAIRRSQKPNRRVGRVLKRLVNHETLFNHLDAECAERVYERVEDLLRTDHHLWLQRGSLHNQHGDFNLAETFLDQALSLEPDDGLVQTEHAHMCFKKACRNPQAPGAVQLATDTATELRRQYAARAMRDTYPVHILGVQGLRWARKAPMSLDQRRVFLRDLRADLDDACDRFPRKRDIQQIRDDVKRELLALGT
ncbi:MAG: SIR2 family protein [Myxococcales bacterium]|nr:SIR2 family protein [Myxococcales bacterium]